MVMKLMELLERFVVAVEFGVGALQSIAKSGNNGANEKHPETAIAGYGMGAQIAADAIKAEAQAKNDAAVLTREFIKKELTARGVTFKTGAKTETLQKLLEGATTVGVGKVEEPGNPFAETPTATTEAYPGTAPASTSTPIGGTPTATKEQARDYLVALSAAKGKDEALSVLKVQGKAEKLSDVDPSRYGLIVDTCKVRGVAINA